MSNGKNLIIVVLAVALTVSLGMWASAPKVVEKAVKQVGAISGPLLPWDYFGIGDVVIYKHRTTALNQASTTICAIQSPVSTSTLLSGSIKIDTGTTTAIVVEMGKSALFDATTTRLSYVTLASGAQLTLNAFVASTTGAFGALSQANTADPNDMVFAPNTYFNVKYGGAKGSLNVLTGSCNATFEVN
jgi:hypothetical protein